ncbi:hypothetical protein SAMN02745866_01274 [Alteromonadaceae bacterium Bs31]|nr:hypothetical protein SAMN02745866_01274 [Alteromonadaceae bacterium Bs31]
MKIANACHLSYCTNIHPGEDWPSLFSSLQRNLPAVKKNVCKDAPFGLGLRLSALAASYLTEKASALAEFKDWLNSESLYVFTINGFPYGTFHGETIKEKVYQPDWRSEARYHYSCQLAELLAKLLPANMHGSISTVPVGFKADFSTQQAVDSAIKKLLQFTDFLIDLESRSGKTVQLALEPEPACYLETSKDCLQFFARLFAASNRSSAEIKKHLGLCLDTCHAAVMQEQAKISAEMLINAGIPLHKIQLTAALRVSSANDAALKQLKQFADPVYLHQSTLLRSGECHFFLDLPEALAAVRERDEIRSHYHVPVFCENLGLLETTQSDLRELLKRQKQNALSTHLEVETYTFDVLPAHLRCSSVVDNISREINWVVEHLQ